MPRYIYKARKSPTELSEGTVEAKTLEGAIQKVIDLGLTPIDVSEQTQEQAQKEKGKTAVKSSGFTLFKKVPASAIVMFTRQICDLVDASVPMLRALELTRNQTRNRQLKEIVDQMYSFVRDGGSLSGALNQHPEVFPKLYVNMVKSGEVSGRLGSVLNRLAELTEKDKDTRDKVRSSLAYPLIILFVGFLTLFVIMTFVIPRLTTLLDELNQVLPWSTLMVIGISGFFARFWWLIIGLAVIVVAYVRRMLQSQKGRLWFDQLKLKTPILGQFIIEVEIGRFARILGTLLESGVVIVAALQSVVAVLNNAVLKSEIEGVIEEVSQGASLTEALKKSVYFPETAVNMIAVGEETGGMEKGLNKLASSYQRQSENTVKVLTSILGPVILIFIVIIIAFVLISILLPVLKMDLLVI